MVHQLKKYSRKHRSNFYRCLKHRNIFLDLKTKYEAEIIDRVAAENKVQGLEEQIALNNRMFEEIASSRVVTTTNDAEAVSIFLSHLDQMFPSLQGVFL